MIHVTMGSLKEPLYFTEFSAFCNFIVNFVLTALVAIIATLAFESPIITLEKLLLRPKTKSNSLDENDVNGTIQPIQE